MSGVRSAGASRSAVLAAAALTVLGVAACSERPAPSTAPSRSDGATLGSFAAPPEATLAPGGERVQIAETTVAVTPRWGPTPNGPELLDEWGENRIVLDPGKGIVVLGEPQPGPDGTWVLGYVIPDAETWPADFTGWIPAVQRGQPTLRLLDREACPIKATIAALAPLAPADRRRCVGGGEITFDARTWYPVQNPAYDADPLWLGANSDQRGTVSLFGPVDAPFPGDAWFRPRDDVAIDARTAPTVETPPLGMLVRVTGHFDDPAAATCTRHFELDLGPGRVLAPGQGVPPEAPEVSVEWCRNQFVTTGWEVVLGPEGRPIDPASPQLHRTPEPPPGVEIGCAGVGMGPLRLRVDPTRLVPVWIQNELGGRAVAAFSRDFAIALDGQPRVVATNRVTLADGTRIGDDGALPGLFVCTGGQVVSFDVRR